MTVTLSAGEKGYLTFSGTAGENLGLGITGITFPCCGTQVSLLDPSGTQIGSTGFNTSPLDWNLPTLPTSSTYTLKVDPGTKTGSVTLTLSDDIVGGSIVVGGASVTASITRVGQNERFTFSGAAGENLGLALTGSTFPCCTNNWLRLLDPTGLQVGAAIFGPSARDWNPATLAATGTYTLLVDAGAPNTGSITLTLSDDTDGGAVAIDGASVTATINRIGQNERFTFAGTAGQNLGMGLTGTTFPCCANNYVYLLNPSGAQIGSKIFGGSPADWNLPALPTTGTYTLIVDSGTTTGSTTLTLSNDIAGGAIAVDGAAVTATINRIGQNERFTFAGTAGARRFRCWTCGA